MQNASYNVIVNCLRDNIFCLCLLLSAFWPFKSSLKMLWCLIYEPNGIIHELHLNKSAKGHECFDKVRILRFCFGQGKPKRRARFHLSCQKNFLTVLRALSFF